MNTYGQSTSLFLSISLSPPFAFPHLSPFLSPSLYLPPKRKVHRCTAILPLHTRPCRAYYERTLCENGDPSRSTPSTRRGGIAAPAARKALEKWRRFVSRICAAPFFVFLYEGR